jgi:hypothetical protein
MSSCSWLNLKEEENINTENPAVARVFDSYLFKNDIEEIAPKGISTVDSLRITENFVRSWVVKQLVMREAGAYLNLDMSEIERKVQDYRYNLIAYEFEKNYVNQRLDKEVTEVEIQEYYIENKENFELKQNIIKGIFVKMPKGAPQLTQVGRWIQSPTDKNREELRSYCVRFASVFHLEDSVWVNFDDIIKNTPLASIPNKVQFLRDNKYVETSDPEYNYFLKILEYKFSEEISPLEFVRDNIAAIIVNRRKVKLSEEMEKEIYEKAKNRNDFEIIRP